MNKDTDNFNRSFKSLVKSIYVPVWVSSSSTPLVELIQHNRIYFYSYGRHALYQGLKICGVGKGDAVLLPELICRDLLSSIHSLGAVVKYYPIGPDLQISCDPENLPPSKAIVAVNYFGFPQHLEPFQKYSALNGSLLVEDNAHGFLSRDDKFRFLGTRGDLGVFSLRKTLPLYNGAALVLNHSEKCVSGPVCFSDDGVDASFGFKVREGIRSTVPYFGTILPTVFTRATRKIRKLKTGHEILPSLPEAEQILPAETRPWQYLEDVLCHFDFDHEVKRRQELFRKIHSFMRNLPLTPVFGELPGYVAPYVYPFFCDPADVAMVKNKLCKYGLECFPWPELPDEISSRPCPEHYSRILGVKLLW